MISGAVIKRRTLLALLLATLFVRSRPAAAADVAQVSQQIVALNAGLLQVMKAGSRASFASRFDSLAPVIDRAFDLPGILRVSVGQAYAGLPEAERSDLLAVFRQFTIASYVANFNDFSGERFEVLPDLRAVGADEVVATRIVPASGAPNRLDYVMRQGEGGWRAVDVLLDGTISRVAVQRSDFRSLLSQGSAAALIASLRKKVQDLSGGTLS
jgi:phospholipid transport system substrate-binding protein